MQAMEKIDIDFQSPVGKAVLDVVLQILMAELNKVPMNETTINDILKKMGYNKEFTLLQLKKLSFSKDVLKAIIFEEIPQHMIDMMLAFSEPPKNFDIPTLKDASSDITHWGESNI